MMGVGELSGDEYLFTGNTGRLDPDAGLGLVLECGNSVDVTVSY
jgi:hypothetical protein